MPVTPVFSWVMPTVGGSSGVWGTELNSMFLAIETTVNSIKTTADAALARAGGTMTGNLGVFTEDYTVVDKGNISSSVTFDVSAGNFQHGTVTGNTGTVAFSNWPASGRAAFITLELTNGGAFTFTWPGAVIWDGGSAPTLQTSGVDVLVFYSRNGGTTIRGMPAGGFNS